MLEVRPSSVNCELRFRSAFRPYIWTMFHMPESQDKCSTPGHTRKESNAFIRFAQRDGDVPGELPGENEVTRVFRRSSELARTRPSPLRLSCGADRRCRKIDI